jgi:hypothetical protein
MPPATNHKPINGKPNNGKLSAFAGRRVVNYRRPLSHWTRHPALRFNLRDVPAMMMLDKAVAIVRADSMVSS